MKTTFRIRILAMSLVALAAFTYSTKSFASFNTYLEITDADGKVTKVDVAKDGTFTTGALKTGRVKVQFFWDRSSSSKGLKSATLNVSATPGGSARLAGTTAADGQVSTGNDRPTESLSFNYTKISMTYSEQKRDAASGRSTGKRQHKPLEVSMDQNQRLLPTVNKKMGFIDIDEDCDGITGKIELRSDDGKTMGLDDWHQ